MRPIPTELIEAIPDEVTADRAACQEAADAALKAMFYAGGDGGKLNYPPIFSNGVELWPLPYPWTDAERRQKELLQSLNGESGYLQHTKENCEEYNNALKNDAPIEAEALRKQLAEDTAAVWNKLNSLAVTAEDEDVYRTLELSDETEGYFDEATE